MKIVIKPRTQFRAYLERKQRWASLVVHRRGGKTFCCIQDLIAKALTHERTGPPLRFAYIAPTRDQAKDVAWGYLKNFTSQILGTEKNESELTVILTAGKMTASIRLYSGDNYERMRGLYFDGVVIDEGADIDPMAWPSVIRPCLTDYQGWATWIGTPKGKNAFYENHVRALENPDEWFTLTLKASESGIIDPAELEDIKRGTAPDVYNQEYECDFNVGMPGAVYARFVDAARQEGRVIKPMPWDRSAPVWTTWDLGSPINTKVVYWQFVGREIHCIDHDTGLDLGPTERVGHMMAKGYPYAGHLLPHDAAAQEKSGKNFEQQLREAGLEQIRIIPRCREVWPGINKCAELFPRIVFNGEKCGEFLKSLDAYHTKQEKTSGFVTSIPVHDWASHDADAFRMLGEAMLNGMLKGHAEVIRETRPDHTRQRKARAGKYTRA